jgi:hypothetical protein
MHAHHSMLLGTFIRSLYELWTRYSGNATLSSYISAYVAVQARILRRLDRLLLTSRLCSTMLSKTWRPATSPATTTKIGMGRRSISGQMEGSCHPLEL